VIVLPSGFLAIGTEMAWVRLLRRVALVVNGSHPLHTIVNPLGIRNEFARTVVSVMVAGSLPPPLTRASAVQVLPPRFGGSYITFP
jgi:hypothetical protein